MYKRTYIYIHVYVTKCHKQRMITQNYRTSYDEQGTRRAFAGAFASVLHTRARVTGDITACK